MEESKFAIRHYLPVAVFAVAGLVTMMWIADQRTVNAQSEIQQIKEVRFSWRYRFPESILCMSFHHVDGEVPQGVNLADDSLARDILKDGFAWAQQRCGTQGAAAVLIRDQGLYVSLYSQGSRESMVVEGKVSSNGIMWYRNRLVEEREEKEKQLRQAEERRREEQDRQRRAQEEARRQAEEARRQAEERARWEAQQRADQARIAKEKADRDAARQRRWTEFVRKNGIQEMIEVDALLVNPFAYQGKTVAIHTAFQRMVSPDAGLFANGNIAVSGLPRDLFRAQSIVVIVGRVTGMAGQVPQLKFIGVHFCKDYACSDMLK